jgi:hypothetical protein
MAVENATVLAVKVQHPLGSDLAGVNRPQPKEVTKQSFVTSLHNAGIMKE